MKRRFLNVKRGWVYLIPILFILCIANILTSDTLNIIKTIQQQQLRLITNDHGLIHRNANEEQGLEVQKNEREKFNVSRKNHLQVQKDSMHDNKQLPSNNTVNLITNEDKKKDTQTENILISGLTEENKKEVKPKTEAETVQPTKNNFDPRAIKYNRFIINEENACHTFPKIDIFAVLHSNPEHAEHRQIIRDTWGNRSVYPNVKIMTLFFMGVPLNPSLQTAIESESSQYHDVIQADFQDTYKNLTFKALAWLEWHQTYCPHVPWILKSDDDMFVNIFNLDRYMKVIKQMWPDLNEFVCCRWIGMPVLRDNSKWFVSKEEFHDDVYPTYCSGSAYLLPGSVGKTILKEFKDSGVWLWVDDAFITGVLPLRAHITHRTIETLYLFKLDTPEATNRLVHGEAIFAHVVSHEQRRSLWQIIIKKELYIQT